MFLKSKVPDGLWSANTTISKTEGSEGLGERRHLMIWQQRKSPEVWTSAGYAGLCKKTLLSVAGVGEKWQFLPNKTGSKCLAKLQLLLSCIFQTHIAELTSPKKNKMRYKHCFFLK